MTSGSRAILIIMIFIGMCSAAFAETFHVPSHEEFKHHRITLDGPWEFYKGRFIPPAGIDDVTPDAIVTAPWVWTDYYRDGMGCGTFRLQMDGMSSDIQYTVFLYDAIGTSFHLYVNGKRLMTVGKPNEDWTKAKGDQTMMLVDMFCDSEGKIDLVLHVSNDFHRKGGIWGNIFFGERYVMQQSFIRDVNRRFIFLGMLFFVVFFHLIFYFTQREDRVSLYLALFTFGIMMRIIVQGFSILKFFVPEFPYTLCLKMEYTPLFLCPAAYSLYIRNLYGADRFPYKSDIYIFIVNMVIGMLIWLGSGKFINRLVPIIQMTFVVSALSMIVQQFRLSFDPNMSKDLSDSGIIMSVTALLIFLFGLHDMATFSYLPVPFPTVMLLPYSALIFVAAQSYITAKNRDVSLERIKNMSESLAETNEIYYKFVPKEFLTLLGKDHIADVKLDDMSRRSLTLMSADVRNFTVMSEKMSESEVFTVLNKYLSAIGPIIRRYGGFIEKYLGDGIIVLFPNSESKAVQCAVAIQNAVAKLSEEFRLGDGQIFRVGIGIHYGEVVLMTVGEEDRMAGLTISGAVNTVMRLESLTKKYKVPIIVSRTLLNHERIGGSYHWTRLDTIRLDDEDRDEDIYAVSE